MGKFPRKVKRIRCIGCEQFQIEEDYSPVELYRKDDFDSDEFISEEEIETTPSLSGYRCDYCGELMDILEDEEVWQCVECDEIHENRDDAYYCCG